MSATAESRIVEYEPSYEKDVHDFWRSILGRAWNAPARRRWEWMNARRSHYLGLVDGRIGGNATLLRQEFVSPEGQPIEVGWITDFFVSPRLKGHGLGKRLTQRLMEIAPNLASFGQSEDARRCFGRLGWTEPRWIPMLGFALPQRRLGRARPFHVEECAPGDPRIDTVWGRRRSQGLFGRRDARALAARFTGRPDGAYRTWLATDESGPMGWVVTRLIREAWNRRFGIVPTGLLVDLFAVDDRQDVLTCLVDDAVGRLARQGAFMVLAVQTSGGTTAALHAAGFDASIRGFGLELRRLPAKGFVASPGASELFRDLPALSFADCDAELTF